MSPKLATQSIAQKAIKKVYVKTSSRHGVQKGSKRMPTIGWCPYLG
ncbi:MAG: hypothetical protein K9L89_08715 [Kiritimatiellales bacterium]|nr:hypothetical protein [Kiritimatiellales bacterium]